MTKKTFRSLLLLALLPAVAPAAPSSNVAWTVETKRLLEQGDAERGKALAAGCAGCHGPAGISTLPMNPHLAGQNAAYTYKQLADYKDRTRDHALMSSLGAGLSQENMVDLAVFYASQPLPAPAEGVAGGEAARTLVTLGDGPRLIPACNSCHGRIGEGNPRSIGMPALAAQTAAYLEQTLKDYRSGARANDVYSVMRAIAKDLSDEEIKATAAFYAGQDARR